MSDIIRKYVRWTKVSPDLLRDHLAFETVKRHLLAELDKELHKEHGLVRIGEAEFIFPDDGRDPLHVPDPFGMRRMAIVARYAVTKMPEGIAWG